MDRTMSVKNRSQQCRIVIEILLMLQGWCLGSCQVDGSATQQNTDLGFYSFTVLDTSGSSVPLNIYSGKVSLVVNVASECGYTHSHYHALTLLQDHFVSTEKFNVLAFPCNQFGRQEPGTNTDILNFAVRKMNANFPVFAKVDVVGPDASPAWTYLINKSGQEPTWNFWKYLVDHRGLVVNAWGPSVSPGELYPVVEEAIERALKSQASDEGNRERPREEF